MTNLNNSLKDKLDWQKPRIANIFDELTLWSAPFAGLLLENIPMKAKSKVLDLGFGTGFPLIELSQRFGADSTIYGMDIWKAGIGRAKEKIEVLELQNIEIFEQSASNIPLADKHVDLICSNLGVNNFEEKDKVFQECKRVLKPAGKLCITTNPIGTFSEFFQLFLDILTEMKWDTTACQKYIDHRGTTSGIIKEIEAFGFQLVKKSSDESSFRFVDSLAFFNHSLIRIAFIDSWEKLVPEGKWDMFFKALRKRIDAIILANGEFKCSVPILYLEFELA